MSDKSHFSSHIITPTSMAVLRHGENAVCEYFIQVDSFPINENVLSLTYCSLNGQECLLSYIFYAILEIFGAQQMFWLIRQRKGIWKARKCWPWAEEWVLFNFKVQKDIQKDDHLNCELSINGVSLIITVCTAKAMALDNNNSIVQVRDALQNENFVGLVWCQFKFDHGRDN